LFLFHPRWPRTRLWHNREHFHGHLCVNFANVKKGLIKPYTGADIIINLMSIAMGVV
jgi:hypothetical protein